MLLVALAQVRVHARRFLAVGLAVMLGVAFLSATLMVGATTTASLQESIGASYAKADLVVTGQDGGSVPTGVAADLAALPGVDAVHGLERVYGQLSTGSQDSLAVLTTAAPARLETAIMTAGSYPSDAGHVALDEDSAARLDVAIGDTVALDSGAPATSPGNALTVTGLIEPSSDPTLAGAVQVLASPTVVRELNDGETVFRNVQLALTPGSDAAEVHVAASAAVAAPASDHELLVVRTAAEQTLAEVAAFSDGSDVLTGVLLAFAAVAVLVAGLVISNTFSVLVAQRTRELALLRCIGADRRQVRVSVLVEAAIVGAASSVLGVLLAAGVMGALVALARQTEYGSFAVLAVPASAVVTGITVGLSMTLLAALVPARAATRVAPLAALRPVEPPVLGSGSGRVRLVAGLMAVLAGGGLLLLGAVSIALVPAVAGGAISFLGVLLLAPFFVPRSVAAVGRITRPLGVPGVLASLNAVRNPARTTASSAALMIGVTLVTMMMTGAQSSRTSLEQELDENYAVDLEVSGAGAASTTSDASGGEPPRIDGPTLLEVDGVRTAVELTPVMLTGEQDGGQVVYAVDPGDLEDVLRAEGADLTDGMVLAPQTWTQTAVTLEGGDGPVTLPVTAVDAVHFQPLITTDTAERLGGTPDGALSAYLGMAGEPTDRVPGASLEDYLGTTYWLRLDDAADAESVTDVQSRIVAATGVSEYQVTGAALERVAYNQVIDVLLLIVTALLAVAVLIALIGVANTLSLSVLERRRENSLLRALGLTRGQLRGMLAVEAVLLAGVAALLGTCLGILYGWLGAQSALGGIAPVSPALPVGQIAAVLAVAVGAGLLASVLPARRAARLSPVAGLAAD